MCIRDRSSSSVLRFLVGSCSRSPFRTFFKGIEIYISYCFIYIFILWKIYYLILYVLYNPTYHFNIDVFFSAITVANPAIHFNVLITYRPTVLCLNIHKLYVELTFLEFIRNMNTQVKLYNNGYFFVTPKCLGCIGQVSHSAQVTS